MPWGAFEPESYSKDHTMIECYRRCMEESRKCREMGNKRGEEYYYRQAREAIRNGSNAHDNEILRKREER